MYGDAWEWMLSGEPLTSTHGVVEAGVFGRLGLRPCLPLMKVKNSPGFGLQWCRMGMETKLPAARGGQACLAFLKNLPVIGQRG